MHGSHCISQALDCLPSSISSVWEKSLRGKHSSLLNEQLFITKCDRVVLLQSATALFIPKCDRAVLQSATAPFNITKCNRVVLQSATAILLQSAASIITKCNRYYKSVTGITKCNVIIKCDSTRILKNPFVDPQRSCHWILVRILVGGILKDPEGPSQRTFRILVSGSGF